MIPQEIADIADLIFPEWRESDVLDDVIAAARRIHDAGYRKAAVMPIERH